MNPLEIDPLALRYGNYILVAERRRAPFRNMPNALDIYTRATATWLADGPWQPLSPDKKMAEEYLSKLDDVCFRTNPTLEETVHAVHAAVGAGTWMQMYAVESDEQRDEMVQQGTAYAMSHVLEMVDHIEHLLNQPLQYRQQDGSIVKCTIVDFGTSRRSGDYYIVVGDDGEEITVSRDVMQDILDKRV